MHSCAHEEREDFTPQALPGSCVGVVSVHSIDRMS